MKQSIAFAPGNISCIFNIIEDALPQHCGSVGVGFTINEGVTVIASPSQKSQILFNEKTIQLSTVTTVLKKLTNESVSIAITTSLPLGGGFGVSGACALATAYAVNELFCLKYSFLELAKIAHVAEVENHTGLGDVTNQYFGGCLLKIKPSYSFEVERLPLNAIPVYCRYFSPLSTKSILLNEQSKQIITTAASNALRLMTEQLAEKKTLHLSDLFTYSYHFAKESGLLNDQQVQATINAIHREHGSASMIMLGNAVMSTIPFPHATEFILSSRPAQLIINS